VLNVMTPRSGGRLDSSLYFLYHETAAMGSSKPLAIYFMKT